MKLPMQPGESWRPVPEATGYYVSTLGRVLSLRQGKPKILRAHMPREGYLRVTLHFHGHRQSTAVHVLVGEAFLGKRKAHEATIWEDGDRSNCALTNLRYGTRKEVSRCRKHASRRSYTSSSKFSDQDVRAIRVSPLPTHMLAQRYGVHVTTIRRIQRKAVFRDVV